MVVCQKRFDEWMRVKKRLSELPFYPECKEGAVYWACLGANLGVEQDGKGPDFTRPVLVLRKYGDKMALVVPLSTKIKYGKYHCHIMVGGIRHTVLLNQIRTVDLLRLQRFLDEVPAAQFKKIRLTIASLISE